MGLIQIPQEIVDKQLKADQTATVADTKSLARHLFVNSYAAGSPACRLDATHAFDLAESFQAEQAFRYPKHETATGETKGVLHGE
jgi:hypothetical protein